MTAYELFARHLDLGPLGGKSRGKVRCIFGHLDRVPSLSVDLERGVFHCFSCGAKGGLRAFAARVGEPLDAHPLNRPRRPRSPREEARAAILRAARRHSWAWRLTRITADEFRRRQQAIDRVRRVAGGDTEATWDLLDQAAADERKLRAVEPLIDDAWRLVTRAPAEERDALVDALEQGLETGGWLIRVKLHTPRGDISGTVASGGPFPRCHAPRYAITVRVL